MALYMLDKFWSAQDGKNRARKCGMLLLASLIFAVLLPYDSAGEFNFVIGAGEWIAQALILMIVTGPIGRLLFPRMIEKATQPALAILVYSASNSLPIFLATILFDVLLAPVNVAQSYGFDTYLWWLVENFGFTLLVIGTLSIVAVKLELAVEDPKPVVPQPDLTAPPQGRKFLSRLPLELGKDLICLEMEDHYIRVHTSLGNDLLHMRMADAITELESFPGLKVHRSWWVATEAIEIVSKQGRDHKAHLINGMIVPISRSHIEAVRELGLIK